MIKKETKKELNPKQTKFCQEYVSLRNATQAAINAGYKKETAYSYGSELLKNPDIKEYIAKLRKNIEAEFYYSYVDSFKNLEKAQELALKRKKSVGSGEYTELIINPDLAAFNKAEELKGKLLGLYEPEIKQEVTINCMGSVKLDGKELELKIGKKPAEVKEDE